MTPSTNTPMFRSNSPPSEPPIAFLDPLPSSPGFNTLSEVDFQPSQTIQPAQTQLHALPNSGRARKVKLKARDERAKGNTIFPVARIQKILKTEHESALSSKEATFLVAVATEEFVKVLARAAHRQATNEKHPSITQIDIANVAQRYEEFNFLEETIPLPITIEEALRRRSLLEKEGLTADPPQPSTSKPPAKHLALKKSKQPAKAKNDRKHRNGVEPAHEPEASEEDTRPEQHSSSLSTPSASSPSYVQVRPPNPPQTVLLNGRHHVLPQNHAYEPSALYYPLPDSRAESPPNRQGGQGRTIYSKDANQNPL